MHEGMADLIYLMNTLLDSKGNILVPGKVCCLLLHLLQCIQSCNILCTIFLRGIWQSYE